MFRPPYLQTGDKVAIVSPAGNIEPHYIENAVKVLRDWGLQPIIGKYATMQYGYFAGTDEQRLEDMQWALDSEEIRAIVCSRGGYGSMRIVEKLDYSTFQGNPKWLIGCSDITVFHTKLNALGIESMHGAMPKSYETTTTEAMQHLKDFLFGKVTNYIFPPHPLNRYGIVRAELTGGNLSLLHCLRDTAVECKHQSTVVFMEDVDENLYALDRMLQSFKLAGKFDKLQGLIIGSFSNMKGFNFGKSPYEIIKSTVEDFDYPVHFGFPAGHTPENYPLIIGSTIELNVNKKGCEIQFL